MQPQRVADSVEPEGVGQLREEQAHDVTPGLESAAPLLGPVLSGQGIDQMGGNQIAQLAQERELTPRWLAGDGFLHGLPCGGSNSRKPTFPFRPINPVGRL